jgi:hypothetical protein
MTLFDEVGMSSVQKSSMGYDEHILSCRDEEKDKQQCRKQHISAHQKLLEDWEESR